MLGALVAELDQAAAQLRALQLQDRQDEVALRLQLRYGQLTFGRAGIADDKGRLALDRRLVAPLQEGRRRGRGLVGVEPHEGDIERMPRKVEIVRIAAERGASHFRREHQPHVAVAAVPVDLVLTAPEKADRLAAQRLIRAAGRQFRQGHRPVAGPHEVAAALVLHGRLHLSTDVDDVQQHLGLQTRAAALVLAPVGQEAVLDVVPALAGQCLDAVGDAVLVGDRKPLGADHRRRTANTEPHGRGLSRIQPLGIETDARRRPDLIKGEPIEGPHALVRARRGGHGKRDDQGGDGAANGHGQVYRLHYRRRITPT